MKKALPYLVFGYGTLLIALAFVGYMHGSRASLYSGGGFGLLVLVASCAQFAGKKWGHYLALTLSALLTAVFALRVAATYKPVPGFLGLLSLTMFLILLRKNKTPHSNLY